MTNWEKACFPRAARTKTTQTACISPQISAPKLPTHLTVKRSLGGDANLFMVVIARGLRSRTSPRIGPVVVPVATPEGEAVADRGGRWVTAPANALQQPRHPVTHIRSDRPINSVLRLVRTRPARPKTPSLPWRWASRIHGVQGVSRCPLGTTFKHRLQPAVQTKQPC